MRSDIRLTESPGRPKPDVPWQTEPLESLRKDANHSVSHLVQADRSTDHARIRTELGTPLIMTENDHRIRAIPILSLHERTPERRFHTEKLKEIPRDEARVDVVGVLPRVYGPGPCGNGRHVLHDRVPSTQGDELGC